MYQTHFVFRVLIILACSILAFACNGPLKKQSSAELPQLVKTIGNPVYGNVQCILEDQSGNLWFGTTENGLYQYDGKSFRRYLKSDGLSHNNITSLLEDAKGQIWIGTELGPCLYNGKTISPISIPLPSSQPLNQNTLYRKKHTVFNMIQTRNGKIWLATIDGVFIYDGKTFSQFELSPSIKGFLSSNPNMERLLEDRDGNIWFGGRTNDGVYRYDGQNITHFPLEYLNQKGATPRPTGWAWPQCQDAAGNLWFGNWGGAYRYDGKKWTSFSTKDGLNGGVTRIIQDRNGQLWMGGDAETGLYRYNGETFQHFTTRDGLINNSIWAILEDQAGHLWIGTRTTGLSHYDGQTFTTRSVYQSAPQRKP